ncbi:hypothetical protein H310_00822 [Aphanomyces invadans]|uniref:Tyrosinase copper-binding domain-containing protein n=1 Tax=Aphanomyces invadans TaxID=157072 RepID=A0A024UX54_9STRA|nr:hypothetical protein H310_00822 [Aphanomyces invadans]ETW10555.1 hypothetical protein H310_00822 [Aphanomyces invadans]|eukprot:XP_008861966.1 hypothetical protein H310_00822 [Aphanomyces invadans]
MQSVKRAAVTAAALVQIAIASDGYCPDIFYDAARVILRSPFLLSTDPSINFQCHSCIANLAAKQAVAPLCYVVGMEGYDPQYDLAKDCHCLSLGLMEECAAVCLPNPLCSKSSPSSACSACVTKQAPASCTRDDWNIPCYETCQQPKCITECSPTPQCHPADPICSTCVKNHASKCDTSAVSFGRQWGAACTAECYSTTCQADCNRRCGDGIKTADEQCDDGNSNNNDGCSTSCQIEAGFACSTKDHALSACNLISCGDARLEGSETCDDGNIVNGDGCSSSCQIERGATCTQPHQLTKSLCSATCGDGAHALGLEACDDGNLVAGDGCSPTCGLERGYACTPDATGKSVCHPVCGDGIVTGKEKCDDKNTSPFDGCSDTCTIELGYKCEINSEGASVCLASCGDGITAFPVEACDDSNRVTGDGCSLECKVEKGYKCSPPSFDGKTSVCAPVCGNALLTGTEKCDDGNTLDSDGCSSSCTVEVGWNCDNSFAKATKSVCSPVCGDGIVKGWEECDEISRACVDCKKVEVPPPRCGDGYTDAGETCDDGNSVAGDGCSATCQVEAGYVCHGRVCQGVCGNGVKTSAEACDDNNAVDGDGCSSSCTVETGYSCSASDSRLSVCAPTCGDGKIIGPETCDDGNTVSGDGCSSTCNVESGFVCTTLSTGVSTCRAVCGDGLLAGGEACDDGNLRSSDGCSSTCRVESGYACTHQSPSVCSTVCGDGIRTANEACDDRNTDNNDGCSSKCTIEIGFECTTPRVGAESSCIRVPTCGDGFVSDSESCDDGNTVSGDGCSKRCRVEALYTCVSPAANHASVCTKSKCSNVRKDWYQLSDQDKAITQRCVTKLFQTGLYQKITGVHVFKPNDQYAHRTNAFVHWHRKWLLIVENMLRSMGGECSCLTLPYWDWAQDAVAMQTTKCASRSQCSGVLRDWGGGASTTSKFVSIPIYNDPQSGVASGSATGYCVLNDVTKDWHAGMELHKYKTQWDPTCPIIRRGWDDFGDENGFFASPLASTSFLNLASSLARAYDYDTFASIALGDIHILPHERSGAYLRTFISPADPVFLLHHTNIDRMYALWEACHGCMNPSRATRTTEGPCYRGASSNDGINDPFVFQFFDPLGNDQFRQVDIDDADDMAEYVPRTFKTPGDIMDTTSLGEYAYSYQTNSMDDRLWSTSGCANRPSILMELMAAPTRHVDLTMLLATTDTPNDGSTNATYSTELAQQYLEWVDGVFTNAHHVLTTLQESNLFSIPYLSSQLGKLQSTEAYLADIVATCECMAINKLLLARTGEDHLTPSFVDVSAATKREWNNRFELRSCFHRVLDMDEKSALTRSYCDVILAPDFAAKLQNLLNDLRGLASTLLDPTSDITRNSIQQIWDYFTKG